MRKKIVGGALACGVTALLGACATSPSATGQGSASMTRLLVDHVNIVDVRDGTIARDRAVLIADGKIIRIAAGGMRAQGARKIDAKGSYIIPGLVDMHVHNLNTPRPDASLATMLASGITGIRQMAPAEPATNAAMVSAETPRLLGMPGRLLAGPAFAAPEAVKTEILRQKEQGKDFIKVVDLPAPSFIAAIDGAREAGLPIAGHLPPAVDPRSAISHGMTSIEHMGPTISLLLACSAAEEPIRAMLNAAPPRSDVDFNMEPAKLQRLLANPVLLTPPQGFALIRRVLATYDEAKCQTFARQLAASGTWIVPTLTRLEAMNIGNSADLRNNPDLRYVPAATHKLWADVGDDFAAKLDADQQGVLADLFASQLKLAKLFDDNGVKMMAGTDFGGQWIVAGRSLHREFDLLAKAGISPLHILQMATIAPARFLDRDASAGLVAVGRDADLVLLDGDPTQSVANLHAVAGVINAGRYVSRAELSARLDAVAASLRQ